MHKTDKNHELIEVYTEEGDPTGRVLERGVIHGEGHPHKVVHTWVVNSRGQLVMQQRSAGKVAHPGMWDISSAGHIVHGESTTEAAQKELAEELGIVIRDTSRFHRLFTVFTEFVLLEGTYIDREWVDVFLVEVPDLHRPHEQIAMQEEEVQDVALVHYAQLEQLMREGHPSIVPVGNNTQYFQLFDMLRVRYPVPPGHTADFVNLDFLDRAPETARPSMEQAKEGHST